MACTDIIRYFNLQKPPYFQLKSTSLKNESYFHSLLNELKSGSLLLKYLRSSIRVQVRLLDSLLSKVEKDDMLRGVFARTIEGLVQSTMRFIGFEHFEYDFESPCRVLILAEDLDECLEILVALFLNILSSGLGFVDNALVSAIVLSIEFQYLVGYVDKGGTKTYNPGSLEFRATYVSLLLFLGAYVWIKFREVAQRTVRRRHKKDKFGKVLKDEFGQVQYYNKWEPRFTPPREKGIPKHDYLPLGGYDSHRDAEVVCQIAGFYYGKDEGVVALADGSHFPIPEMSEQERSLCGEEKRKWVSAKAREVFESFKGTAAREQPRLGAHAADQVDAPGSPSADQLAVVAFPPATTNGNDEFVETLSTLAGEHGPLGSIDDEEIFLHFEIPVLSNQEELNEQLHLQKKQVEADFNRRIKRLTEQHAKQYRRLEVEKSELRQEISEVQQVNSKLREKNLEVRQENKRLKKIIQHAAKTLLGSL